MSNTQLFARILAALLLVLATAGAYGDEPVLRKDLADPSAIRETTESPALLFARRDRDRLAAVYAERKQAADEARTKLAELKLEINEAKTTEKTAVQAIEQSELKIKELEAAKSSAEKELAAARKSVDEANQQLISLQGKLPGVSERKSQADSELKAAIDGYQQSPDAKHLDQAEQAANRVTTETEAVNKILTEIKATQNALAKGQTEVAQQTEAIASADSELKTARDAKSMHESELSAAKTRFEELSKQTPSLQEAKTTAEKTETEANSQLDLAQARVSLFEATPPVADPKSLREVKKFTHNRPMISCQFDAMGQYLFAGSQDSAIQRWDWNSGSASSLAGHRSWVRRFDLHADGELLVSGAYAGRLLFWNPRDAAPEPIRSIDAHKGYVRAVAVSPDQRFVATGGNDLVVRIWSAADGSLVKELPGHANHVYNIRFHPDGRHLVSGDLKGVLKQWEVETWKHVRDLDASVLYKYDTGFRADVGGIRGMDFSPDGRQLVVCGIGSVTNAFAGVGKPTAVLFDWESGKRTAVMLPAKNFSGTMWGVKFHPSGQFIVGVGGSGSGMMWFFRPGEEKSFHDMKLPGTGYDVSFHPDQLHMAVALYDKTVRVYDLGPQVEIAKQ